MAIDIKSFLGNAASTAKHDINNAIRSGENWFRNLIGDGVATLSSLWDGGFVGINANNKDAVVTAINNLINAVQAVADGFNADQCLDGALQGEARTAAVDYIGACKELLNAYISSYKNFIELLEASFSDINAGDKETATAINEEANRIRTQANQIRID